MNKLFTVESTELLNLLNLASSHVIKIANNKVFMVLQDGPSKSMTFVNIATPETTNKDCFSINAKEVKSFVGRYKGILVFYKKDDKIIVKDEPLTYEYNNCKFIDTSIPDNFSFEIKASDLLHYLKLATKIIGKKEQYDINLDNIFIILENHYISLKYASRITYVTQTFVNDRNDYGHKAGFPLHRNIVKHLIKLLPDTDEIFTIRIDDYNNINVLSSTGDLELWTIVSECNYDLTIKTNHSKKEKFLFSTRELKECIAYVMEVGKEGIDYAYLSFNDNICEIISNNRCVTKLSFSSHAEEKHTLHVNLVSLYEVLENIDSELITITKYLDKNAEYFDISSRNVDCNFTFSQTLVHEPRI